MLDKKQKTILSREKGAEELAKTRLIVEGANLEVNEYGNTIFADFFFFITGIILQKRTDAPEGNPPRYQPAGSCSGCSGL